MGERRVGVEVVEREFGLCARDRYGDSRRGAPKKQGTWPPVRLTDTARGCAPCLTNESCVRKWREGWRRASRPARVDCARALKIERVQSALQAHLALAC